MNVVRHFDLDQVMPGFREPVFASQSCFRDVLDALARPGERRWLRSAIPGPRPLAPATCALALTLLDHDTRVWLAPEARNDPVVAFLRFHAGCRLVDDAAAADFAIVTRAADLPSLATFHAGSDEVPESSTTVVVQVEEFDDGPGWRLTGPGIRDVNRVRVHGMPARFVPDWQANGATFPRGVDMILVAGEVVCGLPRTTRIEV